MFLLVALGLISPATWAQSAETGTLIGRVLNGTNNQYIPRAKVALEGTNLSTFTNDFGEYTLINVPVGVAKVTVTFAGQKPVESSVEVGAGEYVTKDFTLGAPEGAKTADGAVMLDEFTVAAARYKNAQEISVNEERTSVNIKNVVSADAFGDIPSGNVGEFVKFLPGVQVDYGAYGGAQAGYSEGTASGVSVRGFGPEDTAILIDGMPVSNATPGSLTRQVGLDMLSVNNASRVELIKVATPDMPANSQGGQINLITKSAFEYAKPSYSGRVFFNFNSQDTGFKKTPGPTDKSTYKTTPGGEFSVLLPLTKTLGVTVTGYAAQQFDHTIRGETTVTTSGSSAITNANGALSLANAAITRYRHTDIPRMVENTSANIRFDWRPTPSQTVTANVQYSTYNSAEAQRRLDFRPTVAAGADWGSNYFTGTTANSTVDMTVTTLDKVGDTISGQVTYKFSKSGWNIQAAGSWSVSSGQMQDRENGHFSEIALKLNPGQVTFANIMNGIPGTITTYNRVANGGGIRDFTQLANYSLDGTIAKSGEASSKDSKGLFRLDVERSLDFFDFLRANPLTFKTGVRRDIAETKKWGLGSNFRQVLDTTKSAQYTTSNFLDTSFVGQSPGFGLPVQQWGSSYKLYEYNQANTIFVDPAPTTADARENWYSYVGQQKALTETTDAAYAMLSGTFFRDRLAFVGGVRQERREREGRGPYVDGKWWLAKNPNGTLYRDSVTGTYVDYRFSNFVTDTALASRLKAAGVVSPSAVIATTGTATVPTTTPADLYGGQLQRQALRPISAKQTGDPSPSLSTSFALTKKIDLKASWSRSFGLPSLEDRQLGVLSGNNIFNISENETPASDGTLGTISVANPNIKPSVSNNWDFQVAYYTNSGGKLGVSFFYKEVDNQAQTIQTYRATNPEVFDSVLNALGLDPVTYQDWRLSTVTNSQETQKTHGFEYEARQDFAFLGSWGQHFQVFASYTENTLGDPATPAPVTITTPSGGTITVTPSIKTITLRANKFAGGGIQFATRRFSAQVRGTYRNQNEVSRSTLAGGNYLRVFEPEQTRIDVNFNYQISARYSAFLSGKDVFNGARKQIIKDDFGLLPEYAQYFDYKKFGITWTVGINAKF